MEYDVVLYYYSTINGRDNVAIQLNHEKRFATIINYAHITSRQWRIKRSNYDHIMNEKHYLVLKYED